MNTDSRAAPPGGGPAGPASPPRWAVKPVRQLTAAELAEALAYLERHRPEDDVLGRALAGEFARRTAAAEFARRAVGDPGSGAGSAPSAPQGAPAAPDAGGARG